MIKRMLVQPQLPVASKLYELASKQLGTELAAAIPARDALVLFEYRDQRALLLKAVKHDFATTNHPISDRLFRVTPDGYRTAVAEIR